MKLGHMPVLLVCGPLFAVSLSGQGGPRSAAWGSQDPLPLLMVANPYVVAAADSAAAVQVGSALRERVHDFGSDDYRVIERDRMNDVLDVGGFPRDAILDPQHVVQFAKHMQAWVVIVGTMVKENDGRYALTARLVGVNDEAGNVVTVRRQPGESLSAFGRRVAEALEPAVNALEDAKACINEQENRPDRAAKSAEKAIKKVPDHGLAHFCLYHIAERQQAPGETTVKHLEAAVRGDPLSVEGWRLLIGKYGRANDTAKTVYAYQQLLRAAPQAQEARKAAFRYFLDAGHLKLALETAEAGLTIDPVDIELYDLKANACLNLRDFTCAVSALEALYKVDSTKADTAFFLKLIAASAAQEPPDTARVLKWAIIGARRFPDNVTLLGGVNGAYARAGRIDSAIAVTRRIIERDTTAIRPALAAVQALTQTDRMTEAEAFVEFLRRYGGPVAKEQLAGILIPVAFHRLQGDSAAGRARDLIGAVDLARVVIDLTDSSSQNAHRGNYVLGLGLFLQTVELDSEAERQKSCDLAKQEQQVLAESKAALSRVPQMDNGQLDTRQYLGYADRLGAEITRKLRAFCK